MSNGFKWIEDATPREGERIEMDDHQNVLKKYNGNEASWPTSTKVQMKNESHKEQQQRVKSFDAEAQNWFKKNT